MLLNIYSSTIHNSPKVAVKTEFTQSWLTLCDHSPRDSPGQNTGVGSLSLLQGIFPTQGWNPDLPIAGGFFTR